MALAVESRRKRGGSNTVPALWQVFRPPKNPGKCCSVAEVKHLVVQERISKVKREAFGGAAGRMSLRRIFLCSKERVYRL